VAFPSISTGAYGFPMERAAGIAIRECFAFLAGTQAVDQVLLVCFGESARMAYAQALRESS